jgi:hypothetical protein
MKAVRPVASRLGLRSSTARRDKPLSKRNATARAVEGDLGGFCVCPGARLGSGTQFLECRDFQSAKVAFTGSGLLKDMLRHF